MNDKQIQQALQKIAETHISNETDLWPEIATKVKRPSQSPIWQWGVRLAGTAVAVFALFLFAAWFFSISQAPEVNTVPRPTSSATRLPFSFTAASRLIFPTAPESLPLYEVDIILPPQTPEAILEWARAFGIPNPKLFRNPRSLEQLIVVDSDGNRLLFPVPEFSQLGISYLTNDWLDDLSSGETFSTRAKAGAAEAFLMQHNQLPANYHLVEKLSPMFDADGYPVVLFEFTPDLSGYPILQNSRWNSSAGATVWVDSSGTVFSAGFSEAVFIETDPVNVRPAAEVIADLIDGRAAPIWHERAPAYIPGQENVTQYEPPLPAHRIGEQVTILDEDYTHFLVAEDGSEVRATLRTNLGAKYELVTPELAHIADIIGNDKLQVTGRIEAQLAPDTWRLVVDSWETMPQQDFAAAFPSGCASGPVTIDETGAWITAESVIGETALNGQYQLDNLPTEIQDGDRIEACSELLPEVGGTIPWMVIYAPPRELDQTGDSGTPSDEYVIESAQLVYFYDSDYLEPALAVPAWLLKGRSKDGSYHIIIYLDATQ